MKFSRVAWLDGDILYVDHLENSSQMLAQYIRNYHGNNESGIRYLEIDQVAFSSGLLSIKRVECIFPDGSFVAYESGGHTDSSPQQGTESIQIKQESINDQYSVSYAIQPDDAVQGRQLYLGVVGEEILNREIKLQDGTMVNMPVLHPQIAIFTDPQENRVALLRVVLKGGVFIADVEFAKLLRIDVRKRVDFLIFSLQNLFLVESDKSEVDFLLLSNINCAISILMSIACDNCPKNIYNALLSCMGHLSWKTGKQIQPGPSYDLNFPLKSVNQILQKMDEILEYLSVSYKKVEFVQNGAFMVSNLNNFDGYENMIIVAEPYSEENVQELFGCIICSENMLEEVRKKRTFGMMRKKQKDEMKFIVPLQGQFFDAKQKMVCSMQLSKFSRIAFYVK